MNNSSISNLTNSTSSPSPLQDSGLTAPRGITPFTHITYSVIATIAFLGNMLVISIFWRDRRLLKKSYNMLILSLAIADVLTAITLITNPALVLGDAFPYPTNHILSDIFRLPSYMEPWVPFPVGGFLRVHLLSPDDGALVCSDQSC